ncbi:MAG TPA: hypothetical protein VLD38_03795 [Nitrosopumilaceae archaeon]|nr:hypothetical protein [Nitrosopumilaceae archaeon]
MITEDTLLAESVRAVIKENLSKKALEKIEYRLAEKHHTSIPQQLNDYPKLEDVLREYFGAGAEKLGKMIIERMHVLEKSKA